MKNMLEMDPPGATHRLGKFLRVVKHVSVWLNMLFLVAKPLKQSKSFHNVFLGPKERENSFHSFIALRITIYSDKKKNMLTKDYPIKDTR